MADIIHHFPINAPRQQVFAAVSTPTGIDAWWTKRSAGKAVEGEEYELWFGPDYDWRAVVTRSVPDTEFEIEFTRADADWLGTRVGFALEENDGITQVRFRHSGWSEANEHYSISSYCWAMYLRLLGRYVVDNDIVKYEDRLEA